MFKRYRRIVELMQAFIITGLPFLRIKGESALRFDIPTLKLYLFGTVIWIREFYLLLLILVFFIFLIISVTNVFGRIWCGWLCPQTVLLDLSSDVTTIFPLRLRDKLQKLVLLPLSALVSMTLIWYFVPPEEMLGTLFSNKLITLFFLVLWIVIYSELAFLGRRFCTSICPYSMLQSGLFDRDTLVIDFEGSQEEGCMGCDKCVRVCPVGIDIKKGLRRECVACAECIDACRSMTLPRNLSPFISYRGRLLRGKTFMLGAVNVVVLSVFLVALFTRPPFDV
ncbi:MAG: 4Fe-4S binding protein, partial [Nitrospirae bacterium]|nr:4Fe-4S binding protein [Nitrospirota bacterium]